MYTYTYTYTHVHTHTHIGELNFVSGEDRPATIVLRHINIHVHVYIHIHIHTHTGELNFVSGEDRPATIVLRGHYAFIGFGSAWAEGASSVVKVDLDRMVRVSGVVTKEGQTWLYTGVCCVYVFVCVLLCMSVFMCVVWTKLTWIGWLQGRHGCILGYVVCICVFVCDV